VSAATVKDHKLRSKPIPDAKVNLSGNSLQTSEAQDIDIVRQLQAGNHDALTLLFQKYSGMVFLIARRILQDDGEAEEVVQQVFLEIYRAINQFDERKGSVKTWLFQYCYHRTLNRKKHLETKGFYSRYGLEEQQLPMEDFEGAGRRIRLCSQEVGQLIEQLLKSIHPRQRVAIELTFFDGLTAEEIAGKTGETAVTVRHNLYRGLSKLRCALLQGEKGLKAPVKREIEGILLGDPARLL
jgi:RNA polymerase sigma-70 factor, ECF subfamily